MSSDVSTYSKRLSAAQNFYQQGDNKQSEKLVSQLLAEDQDHFESQFLAALLRASNNDFNRSIFHFNNALSLSDNIENQLNTHLNIAQCYLRLNQPQLAITEFQVNLNTQSNHLQSWRGLAECHTRLGSKDEACEAYLELLKHSKTPRDIYYKSIAYHGISETHDVLNTVGSEYSNQFINNLKDDIEKCSESNLLVSLYFSLAKIYERQRNFTVAFENFAKGNKIKSQSLNYQHHSIKSEADKTINYFKKNIYKAFPKLNCLGKAPIFIVGLPRSNSTLIESLLSCSNNTRTLGETGVIPELIQSINFQNNYPEILNNLKITDYNKLKGIAAKEYHLDSAGLPIDKLPANFWNIGLIKMLFPNAKIIHCFKSPIEACLSLFRQNFIEGHPYAYSLKDSADYYDLHIELMNHWKTLFPDQIHSMNYQDFIQNPEQQAMEMFDYCHLQWDSNYLSEYMNRENVTTASSFQVRTKIHSNANDLVQNYIPQLDYLVNRYAMAP